MTEFCTPVGRLVQGGVTMRQEKDMDTNQLINNPDGSPKMSVFFALAFPKVLADGMPNTEFDEFWALIGAVAQAEWPRLFNAQGECTNPKFSWKYQDGDGHDTNGKSVANKPGFAGHHIVKFSSLFPVKCFIEGQFSPHQELQDPAATIKLGDWVRVYGDMKSNMATGTQVPGIAIYPSLVSYVGRGERISTGPDASAAFGSHAVGYVPAGVTAPNAQPNLPKPPGSVPNLPKPPGVPAPGPGVPKVTVPRPPAVVIPPPPAAEPKIVVAPQFAAQGITVESILEQGWTADAAIEAGYLIRQ